MDLSGFLEAVASGREKPETVRLAHDSEGPLTIFDFPRFRWQIHAHFKDVIREEIGRAEVVSYDREKLGFVDNVTLAMLRHYAEVRTRRSRRVFVIVGLVLAVIVGRKVFDGGEGKTSKQEQVASSAFAVVPSESLGVGVIEARGMGGADHYGRRVRPVPYTGQRPWCGRSTAMDNLRYHASVQDGEQVTILARLETGERAGRRRIRAGKMQYTFDDPGPVTQPEMLIELPDGTTGWVAACIVRALP